MQINFSVSDKKLEMTAKDHRLLIDTLNTWHTRMVRTLLDSMRNAEKSGRGKHVKYTVDEELTPEMYAVLALAVHTYPRRDLNGGLCFGEAELALQRSTSDAPFVEVDGDTEEEGQVVKFTMPAA